MCTCLGSTLSSFFNPNWWWSTGGRRTSLPISSPTGVRDHCSPMAETPGGSDGTGQGGIFPFPQGGEGRRCVCVSPSPPPALPGFFGRILCRWGSASPTCGTSERASPARCHGEESVFPTREENLRRDTESDPRPRPRPRPAAGGRSPGGGPRSAGRRGRPGPHQLGVERRGEAVDPARVPDHPVEEIGHAQEAATGVSRGADQQPQQRQPRGGTCGELGVGGGVVARPGPARSARSPSALTCSPRRPGEGHDAAEPAARLAWAGVAPASPIYICRVGMVSGGKPFLSWRVPPWQDGSLPDVRSRGQREQGCPRRGCRLGGRERSPHRREQQHPPRSRPGNPPGPAEPGVPGPVVGLRHPRLRPGLRRCRRLDGNGQREGWERSLAWGRPSPKLSFVIAGLRSDRLAPLPGRGSEVRPLKVTSCLVVQACPKMVGDVSRVAERLSNAAPRSDQDPQRGASPAESAVLSSISGGEILSNPARRTRKEETFAVRLTTADVSN